MNTHTHIYIYYSGHQLRLRCAQVHHRSPAGTFTQVPGRCLHWSPTPPGPRWPPAYIILIIEVLHLCRCVTHAHTPCLWQGGAMEDEVKMRMRGKWRWGDLEDEIKNYLTRTRSEQANPERAREKKSGGSTDTEQDQRRGGRTKAPEPT